MVTKSNKPSKFVRFVIYPIIGIIFLGILFFILLLASGYKPFFNDGKLSFQKTGMVIITTKPSGAKIFVDNKYTKNQTIFTFLSVTIKNLKPGQHLLEIEKPNYQTWKEEITIKPNLVTWKNYILLFQNKLNLVENNNLNKYTEVTSSNNNGYLLFSYLNKTTNSTELYLYNVVTKNMKKIWPTDKVLTQDWLQNPQIISANFSNDNNKILLNLKNNNSNSLAILDVSGSSPVYSYQLAQPEVQNAKILWNPRNSNELMALSSGNLFYLGLGSSGAVSDNLVEKNVIDYSIESNGLVYFIQNTKTGYELNKMRTDGSNKVTITSSIVNSPSYAFAYSSQRDIIAILPSINGNLTAYYSINGQPSTLLLDNNVKNMTWSKDGDYIVYYNKNSAKIFNWKTMVEYQVNDIANINSLDWYNDSYHLLVDENGILSVIDIDGSNKIKIDNKVTNYWLYNLASIFYTKAVGNNISYEDLSLNF